MIHPLRIHFHFALSAQQSTLDRFAVQFTLHLNSMLSDTARQFQLTVADYAPIPGPSTQPAVLPDAHPVDLYFFPSHATRSGTWTIGAFGEIQIHIPLSNLWIAPAPHGFEEYVTTLAKFMHEWAHARGCRGEGYALHNADPPEGIPMPPVNVRGYPNDIYWTAARRTQLLDPFFTTHPIEHFAVAGESQDLAWVLKNVRPCAGTASIIRGAYRKGAPWKNVIRLSTELKGERSAKIGAWCVPSDYHDPWELVYDGYANTAGEVELVWNYRGHGYPFMGIRVDSENHPPCVGYLSIFELEWLYIAGIEAIVRCDMATGAIYLPPIPVLPPPRRSPPWESDPRWKTEQIWGRARLIMDWIRKNPGVTIL